MTVAHVESEALLTLATTTVLQKAGPVMTRGGKLLSVRGSYSIHTLSAGNGPFLYGIADKSLSGAQLKAYLELDGPVTPDVVASREIASRGNMIRTLGTLVPQGDGTVCGAYLDNRSLKGLKFSEESAGWNLWVYNLGAALTTGAIWISALQFFAEFNPSG